MENKVLSLKDSGLAFAFGFLACQLAVLVFNLLGTTICALAKIDTTNFALFLNTCFGYLLTVVIFNSALLAIFFFFNKGKQNSIISKPKISKILIYILVAVTAYFMLSPIINCVDSLIIKLGINLNTIPYELNTTGFIVSLFSLAIIPAICEELLFRGLIFKGLKSNGKAFSIIVSAIMFSLFHMAIEQTVYPLLIGLLLAVIMYYENNIIYCITLHLTNNVLSLIMSYFNIGLVFNHWTYILLSALLCALFVGIVMYFTFKNNKGSKIVTNQNKNIFYICLAIMVVVWIAVNLSR